MKVNGRPLDLRHCNSNPSYLFFPRPLKRIRHTGTNFARKCSLRISNWRTAGFGGLFAVSMETLFLATTSLPTISLGPGSLKCETVRSDAGVFRGGSG